jgi:hypothetical protein
MLGAPDELKARPSGMKVALLGKFFGSGCFTFPPPPPYGRPSACLSIIAPSFPSFPDVKRLKKPRTVKGHPQPVWFRPFS